MAEIGRVRSRVRQTKVGPKRTYYLDFRPHLSGRERFLTGDRGHGFTDQQHAESILSWIQSDIGRLGLSAAVGQYRAPRHRLNLVSTHVAEWLEDLHAAAELSPYTLEGYRSVVRNHFGFWAERTVPEINYHALAQWRRELVAKGLAGKTIKAHVFAAFRAFCGWESRRADRFKLPVFPRVRVERAKPQRMPLSDLVRAIAAIPEADRGIFLCLASTTIRPGEARALQIRDYDWDSGKLWVGSALQGKSGSALRGPTKTGEAAEYPLGDDLRAWLEEQTPTARRLLPDAPLFPSPRTGRPYRMGALTRLWERACGAIDAPYVSIYPATKHSPGTALVEAGISIADVQALYRHRSAQTTRLYLLEDSQRRNRALGELDRMLGDALATDSATRGQPTGNPRKCALEPLRGTRTPKSGGRARVRTAPPDKKR